MGKRFQTGIEQSCNKKLRELKEKSNDYSIWLFCPNLALKSPWSLWILDVKIRTRVYKLTEGFKEIQSQHERKAYTPLKFWTEKQRNGCCSTKTNSGPLWKGEWVSRGHIIWTASDAHSTEGRPWSKKLEDSAERCSQGISLCLPITAGAGSLFPRTQQLQHFDRHINSN